MNCLVCSQKIDRSCSTKINCSECKQFFHYASINISKDDADYLKANVTPFRCDKCSVLRRRSLHLPVSVVDKPNNNSAPTTSNGNCPQPTRSNILSSVAEPIHNNATEDHCAPQMVYEKLLKLEDINHQFLLQVNELRTENAELKSRVNVLESKLNWQQQNLLSNSIEIVGVPNVADSNAIKTAQQIFTKALSIDVPNKDIEKCYVKKTQAKSSSGLKTMICLRFASLTTKQRIMCTKRNNKNNLNTNASGIDGPPVSSISSTKKGSGTRIFINDALTKFTQALLMKTKETTKRKGGKYDDISTHQLLPTCRCDQPGFDVNPESKNTQDARMKIVLAASLCGIFMIVEFLGGYMAGSLAIVTDAAHLASDCISFVIGLLAIWISSRPSDQNMSFGYKRIEVIGAVTSILMIWGLTATLIYAAVQRLFLDDFFLDANIMMTIAGIGILINIAMGFILHGSSLFANHHGHSHGHSDSHSPSQSHNHAHGHLWNAGNSLPTDVVSVSLPADNVKQHQQQPNHQHQRQPELQVRKKELAACGQEQNLNLRAAVIHVFGDLIQSVGVFVASVVIKFYPHAKLVDPLCTLLFSVIVILTTINLFRESIGILLDSVPKLVSISNLRNDLSSISGVKSVHHLNVWNHTVNHGIMMVHLVVDIPTDSESVLLEATSIAHNKYHIKHSTIQIERL